MRLRLAIFMAAIVGNFGLAVPAVAQVPGQLPGEDARRARAAVADFRSRCASQQAAYQSDRWVGDQKGADLGDTTFHLARDTGNLVLMRQRRQTQVDYLPSGQSHPLRICAYDVAIDHLINGVPGFDRRASAQPNSDARKAAALADFKKSCAAQARAFGIESNNVPTWDGVDFFLRVQHYPPELARRERKMHLDYLARPGARTGGNWARDQFHVCMFDVILRHGEKGVPGAGGGGPAPRPVAHSSPRPNAAAAPQPPAPSSPRPNAAAAPQPPAPTKPKRPPPPQVSLAVTRRLGNGCITFRALRTRWANEDNPAQTTIVTPVEMRNSCATAQLVTHEIRPEAIFHGALTLQRRRWHPPLPSRHILGFSTVQDTFTPLAYPGGAIATAEVRQTAERYDQITIRVATCEMRLGGRDYTMFHDGNYGQMRCAKLPWPNESAENPASYRPETIESFKNQLARSCINHRLYYFAHDRAGRADAPAFEANLLKLDAMRLLSMIGDLNGYERSPKVKYRLCVIQARIDQIRRKWLPSWDNF